MAAQLTLADHLAAGERLKQEGLDAAEARDGDWVERMRFVARQISREQGQVTADDLRRHADHVRDQPAHKNAWGSVFRGKGWRAIGYEKSSMASNHGRRITVWEWAP